MKKYTLAVLLLLVFGVTRGQQKNHTLLLGLGRSWHGTGDLPGLATEVEYRYDLRPRLALSHALTTTLHYRSDNLSAASGNSSQALRFTTAGVQLNTLLNLYLLSFSRHRVLLSAGPLLRLQPSSRPQSYGYIQEPWGSYYVIYQQSNRNTLSPGYSLALSYQASIAGRFGAGLRIAFQNDTNADTITQVSLLLSRSLTGLP